MFDHDGDGGLDKEEYKNFYKNLSNMVIFILSDLNRDGFITIEEAMTVWKKTDVTGMI